MTYPDEIQANLDRADAALQAAQVLIDSDLLDDAASRTYYAAFYAASALLLSKGLSFNSHTGVLRAISLNFVKTGKLDRRVGQDLNWLAELRQVGDYGETRHVSQTSLKQAIAIATQFVEQIRVLLQGND
ncbi:MAG: HEPN domain-containing protein [Cyanobacteria bacterium P01_H01_bin.21]